MVYPLVQVKGSNMIAETSQAAAKIAPPASVVAAHFAGLPLADWAVLSTIVYTVVMTAFTIWQWVQKAKEKKE